MSIRYEFRISTRRVHAVFLMHELKVLVYAMVLFAFNTCLTHALPSPLDLSNGHGVVSDIANSTLTGPSADLKCPELHATAHTMPMTEDCGNAIFTMPQSPAVVVFGPAAEPLPQRFEYGRCRLTVSLVPGRASGMSTWSMLRSDAGHLASLCSRHIQGNPARTGGSVRTGDQFGILLTLSKLPRTAYQLTAGNEDENDGRGGNSTAIDNAANFNETDGITNLAPYSIRTAS